MSNQFSCQHCRRPLQSAIAIVDSETDYGHEWLVGMANGQAVRYRVNTTNQSRLAMKLTADEPTLTTNWIAVVLNMTLIPFVLLGIFGSCFLMQLGSASGTNGGIIVLTFFGSILAMIVVLIINAMVSGRRKIRFNQEHAKWYANVFSRRYYCRFCAIQYQV